MTCPERLWLSKNLQHHPYVLSQLKQGVFKLSRMFEKQSNGISVFGGLVNSA